MSLPKNKCRKIVVGGEKYEWCYSKGTLYYKHSLAKNLTAVKVEYTWDNKMATTPMRVANIISAKIGGVATPAQIEANKASFKKDELASRAKFKLYVWTGVLTDWTDGIMFAYARSLNEARESIRKSIDYKSESIERDLVKEPNHIIHGKPEGFHIWGGS